MKQYSADLRERLLGAIDGGLSLAAAARLFAVSEASIRRWRRQRRATGTVTAKPRPGRPPTFGPTTWPALDAQLRAMPDATLATHCAVWEAATGVAVSPSTLSRVLHRHRWTRKKRA
jgi:transposase